MLLDACVVLYCLHLQILRSRKAGLYTHMHAGSMDLLEAKISLDTNSRAHRSDVPDCAG